MPNGCICKYDGIAIEVQVPTKYFRASVVSYKLQQSITHGKRKNKMQLVLKR